MGCLGVGGLILPCTNHVFFLPFFPLLSNPKFLLGILYLPCCAHTPFDSSIIVLYPACCPPSHWSTLPFPAVPFILSWLAFHPPPLTGLHWTLQPSYCWSYLTLPHSPLPSCLLFFFFIPSHHYPVRMEHHYAWFITPHHSPLQHVCYPSPFFSLSLFLYFANTWWWCYTQQGEDLERNDGSLERPYYMSPELSQILLKKDAELLKPSESQSWWV